MRIAVCDDHPLCLRELERQLREIPLVREIRCFSVPEALFQAVRAGEVYDAVLLDIDFRTSDTGIDAAEALYALSPGTRIIYMTGYTDRFVQQIFLRKSNLCGYLTKPVDPALLAANLQKLVRSAAEDGGLTLRVMETPGHSEGSVCLLLDKEHVIFAGDTLFRCSCGRCDFPGGSYPKMLTSLARLAALEGEWRVLPGHDRETTMNYERRVNPYVRQGMKG